MRWAVHSEPPRSMVAELPCQPHVQVIVWAWCLYSSITCLNGSFAMAGLTGGRLFNARTPARCARGATGNANDTRFRRFLLILVARTTLLRPQVVPDPTRQPADLTQ